MRYTPRIAESFAKASLRLCTSKDRRSVVVEASDRLADPQSLIYLRIVGLDPTTQADLSPLLFSLAQANSPRLLITLRPQDPIPEWITHLVYLSPSLRVGLQGSKDDVLNKLQDEIVKLRPAAAFSQSVASDGRPPDNCMVPDTAVLNPEKVAPGQSLLNDQNPPGMGEPVVGMEDVVIKYGEKQILGDWTENYNGEIRAGLRWTVRKGERWGVFGPNGRPERRPCESLY